MSVRAIFDCDICKTKNITDGVTMVFQINEGSELSAPLHHLVGTYKGLHFVQGAPQIEHICSICVKSIINAKEYKK